MKLDNLGWKSMTTMRDEVYPDLVAHFYANASREYRDESVKSFVKGKSFSLNRYVIREILGIGYEGGCSSKGVIGYSLWTKRR